MKKIFTAISLLFFVAQQYSFSQTDPLVASGLAKQKKSNHTDAITDFTSAIKTHDADVQKYLKKLDDYEKVSEFDRVEKGMEAPKIDSSFAIPYYLRGVSLSATGKDNDALNDFNTAVKIYHKLGAAYYERGKIKYTSGKKDEGCIDLGT
ncbi:MAG: hypothetical protein ACHQHP_05070, partial [Bacteroidia bacterium]